MSEQDVEAEHNFPREILHVWAGRPFEIPEAPRDIDIRRRVVLAFYLATAKIPWGGPPTRLLNRFASDLELMQAADPDKLAPNQIARLQAVSIYLDMADAVFESDLKLGEVHHVLRRDFRAGIPSPLEVKAEYDRWYHRNGEAAR